MNGNELREAFQRFFEERGHRRMPSAPLVPPGDPTLLFTSSGMVQFKPYFMGQAKAPHNRLTTVQKCFRTSDIDSVGDSSHLTFFEMLGNFSVGDYFKDQAIPWAWEFVTDVLRLPSERLWATVYLDDDEAHELWLKTGVPAERIRRYGEEHNYWFSGDVGPCGPCSELYYDFGEEFGCGPECEPSHDDCDRFLEIWNLVFMSFYCDGEKRDPLPSRNIDTGAGLERIASVLLFESAEWEKRSVPSVYETDLFAPIVRRVEELSGKRYGEEAETDRALRIVAEHARAVTFLIGDERTPVTPSNEERGYVVRRLLRRAVYFGRRQLGIEEPLMPAMADAVIDAMSASYPELERQRQFVLEIVEPEERRFDQTLSRGLEALEESIRFHNHAKRVSSEFASSVLNEIEDLKTTLHHIEDLYHNTEARMRAVKATNRWVGALDEILTRPGMARFMFHTIGDFISQFDRHVLEEIRNGLNAPIEADFLTHLERQGVRPDLDRISPMLAIQSGIQETDPRPIDLDAFQENYPAALSDLLEVIGEHVESAVTVTGQISGLEAFLLHDTHGFPIELTKEIAAKHGLSVDEAGFEAEMERQRERARAHAGGADAVAAESLYASLVPEASAFLGYETLESQSKVVALVTFEGGERIGTEAGAGPAALRPVDGAESPAQVEVFLDATPFYPEGGGQVGDRGEIIGPNGRVRVEDTQRVAERLIVHRGRVVGGRIATADEVTARVDLQHRADTMRNHTATHLLHAALRQVLGTHVRQQGSVVAPDHLRFDFTHTEALSDAELAEVERLVNEKVRQDLPVETRMTTFDAAMSEGVLAFFGDKYGEEVRVVEVNSVVPKFSAELCGGTHCHHTGQIGAVMITGESSIGAGMRRIEALTGRAAEDHAREQREALDTLARRLGAPRHAVMQKVESLLAELDSQRKKIERLERSLASAPASDRLVDAAVDVDGVRVLSAKVDAPSVEALRYVGDSVRQVMPSGVAVLGAAIEERPMFIAMVSRDLLDRGLHAGNLLKRVAQAAGGGGGGRPDMAQGGGKDPSKIDEALALVPGAVREMLGEG